MKSLLLSRHIPFGAGLLLLLAGPAASQELGIRGLLVSRTAQTPITNASITVSDSTALHAVQSDREGRFLWRAARPGLYTLKAAAIGYIPGEWSVQVDSGRVLSVTIELEETPVPLPEIKVEADPIRADLKAVGFDVRRAKGIGVFFAEEDLHRKQATKLSDLMRDIAGVREVCRTGVCHIRMTRNRDCEPNFFLNGLPANNSTPTDLSLVGIIGIEVYRTESETPTQFLRGLNACGTIVLWTLRGR